MTDEFIRLGHTVFGCARTQDQIEELSCGYPGHDFQVVDVASDAAVGVWAKRLIDKYGPPEFVVNNAAILNLKAFLWEVEDREFSYQIDINIKGVVNVIRHFAPSMIVDRRGVIVNFTSRWGQRVERKMAPYCATKWANVAITKVLAKELEPDGIAVVGLNPGVVRTGMLERYLGNPSSTTMSSYPDPLEWAKATVPFILRLGLEDTGKFYRVPGPLKNSSFTQVA